MNASRCWTCAVAMLAIVGSFWCSRAAAADDECSDWVLAWGTKLRGRGAREEQLAAARQEAVRDLARRAWSVSVYREREERVSRVIGGSGAETGFFEDELVVDDSRTVFRVSDRLLGGSFEEDGDRSRMSVRYCLPQPRFDAARDELERERHQLVGELRERFAELERAVADRSLEYAGRLFAGLKSDVNAAVADFEVYTSTTTGERQSFRSWLERWSGDVRSAHTYAAWCTDKAGDLVERGALGQAESHLREALVADRLHVPALQLEERIAELRTERQLLLSRAEELAAVGAVAAANRRVAAAESIDSDDAASLETARDRVSTLAAGFARVNPRWNVGLSYWQRSMAVDGEATLAAMTSSRSADSEVDRPSGWGLELSGRLGRWGRMTGLASYGTSTCGGGQEACLDYTTFAVGAGLATPKTRHRPFSFTLIGGAAREQVGASVQWALGAGDDVQRTAAFARVGVELRHLGVFVQHGFGFADDDTETSTVGWRDGLQMGLVWSFR